MCAFRGRAPVYIFILSLMLWAIPVTAQQRVPLTIAEAEDLAITGEPGRAALLARARAFEEQAVAAGQQGHGPAEGSAGEGLDGAGLATVVPHGLPLHPTATGTRADQDNRVPGNRYPVPGGQDLQGSRRLPSIPLHGGY